MNKGLKTLTAGSILLTVGSMAQASNLTGNVGVTNNYIWRGLTQSINETAVQGGIDWTHNSGFYAGTWTSNVSYLDPDEFSYEHDIYFGFAGESNGVSYDVGYLYYNYDTSAQFDFGEVYASVGFEGFTFGLYVVANTQPDEEDFDSIVPTGDADFGFGETTYVYLDYALDLGNGLELGLHAGRHDGDFNIAFNNVAGGYNDYNVSLSKDGFTFMITDTSLNKDEADALNLGTQLYNDEPKFVVSYNMDIDL